MFLYVYSVIQGIVQGITELLPISSTAHLLLFEELFRKLGFHSEGDNFNRMFDVVIQFGSILAFLLYFHEKLLPKAMFFDKKTFHSTFMIWFKAGVGVIPAAIVGFLGKDWIQSKCYNIPCIAAALGLGGIVILLIESRKKKENIEDAAENLPWSKAIGIGCCQCLALFPGVSRSASTIFGGMLLGTSRKTAVEYSFFLAIPTMAAASGYSLLRHASGLSVSQWIAVGIGFAVSFFVSWVIVVFFMRFIRTRDLKVFGWYRIALAVLLCLLLMK